MRVYFTDGSFVDYPEGVGISESQDQTLMFVNDAKGIVIATLTALEVKSSEKLS